MPLPTAEDILRLDDETLPSFILAHAKARTLTAIMRDLNRDILGVDRTARSLASRAVARLGFPLHP